jgi:DNA-binding response OmpR family regulator
MAMKCPCCGQPVETVRNPATVLALLPLSPQRRRLLDKLANRFGQFVTRQDLVNAIYADDVNGGPETADNHVSVMVHQLRKLMRDTPLLIDANVGGHGGYRLVWRVPA